MIHHLTESGQGASISVSTENGCFFKGSAAFYLASAGKIEHYFFETTGAFAESGPSHGPEENPVPLLKREVISSEKKNGIWDYELDGDKKGVTLTLKKPGTGLLYMEAGEPVNDGALVVVEVNLQKSDS